MTGWTPGCRFPAVASHRCQFPCSISTIRSVCLAEKWDERWQCLVFDLDPPKTSSWKYVIQPPTRFAKELSRWILLACNHNPFIKPNVEKILYRTEQFFWSSWVQQCRMQFIPDYFICWPRWTFSLCTSGLWDLSIDEEVECSLACADWWLINSTLL